METIGTDVLIVGSSFSGLALAYSLPREKYAVILDKKNTLWSPSTGLVTPPTLKLMQELFPFDIPVENSFYSMNIVFKDIGEVTLSSDSPFMHLLNKNAFFEKAKQYLPENVELYCGYSFVSAKNSVAIVKSKARLFERQIHYQILIGADGCFSTVAKIFGLPLVNSWMYGYEWETGEGSSNDINFVIDPDVSRAYGIWAFPSNNRIRIGFASDSPIKKSDLEQISQRHFSVQSQPSNFKGGAIPTSGPIRRFYTDNVFLIGDAAGLCGPFLGDGIQTAIKSAMAAAQAIGQSDAGNTYVQLLKDFGVIKYLKQQALLRSFWDRFVSRNTLKRLYRFTLKNRDHLLEDLVAIKENPSGFLSISKKFFN